MNEIITSLTISSTAGAEQTNVPITFGQVFKAGDLPRGTTVRGLLTGIDLDLQVKIKARHADGSARHAIISAIVPQLAVGSVAVLDLVRAPAPVESSVPFTPATLPVCDVALTVDGVAYTAPVLEGFVQWLSGSVVREGHHTARLRTAEGTLHPHLTARFGFRQYATGAHRVEVVIENTRAYEPVPRNFTYDISIQVAGRVIAEHKGVVHYHHARWRTVAWVGEEPGVHIIHDTDYLIDTLAFPNYDPTIIASEKMLARVATDWAAAAGKPMSSGLTFPGMPDTGGRDDIGILPGWQALWLLSMDLRAKTASLGTADKAGSWSVHYRDEKTDLPISVIEHPYMTIKGIPGDTRNPKTGVREAFPPLSASTSATPLKYDTAHCPSLNFMPYLLTGDLYHLEEVQFFASYGIFESNPGYRKSIHGWVQSYQVRGQAWALRNLAHAAYATPDAHPLKRHYTVLLASNMEWYRTTYVTPPAGSLLANNLGVLMNGTAAVYAEDVNDDGVKDPRTAVAPWQDDFFTQTMGHLVELGFKEAMPVLQWKIKFPIGRMIGDGYCWMLGANYTIAVRASDAVPPFATFREVYVATVGNKIASLPCGSAEMGAAMVPPQKAGDMGGYSQTAKGFPSNMQPALAYAAQYGGEEGKRAWSQFMSRTVKPLDYGSSPQFAIVPRSV